MHSCAPWSFWHSFFVSTHVTGTSPLIFPILLFPTPIHLESLYTHACSNWSGSIHCEDKIRGSLLYMQVAKHSNMVKYCECCLWERECVCGVECQLTVSRNWSQGIFSLTCGCFLSYVHHIVKHRCTHTQRQAQAHTPFFIAGAQRSFSFEVPPTKLVHMTPIWQLLWTGIVSHTCTQPLHMHSPIHTLAPSHTHTSPVLSFPLPGLVYGRWCKMSWSSWILLVCLGVFTGKMSLHFSSILYIHIYCVNVMWEFNLMFFISLLVWWRNYICILLSSQVQYNCCCIWAAYLRIKLVLICNSWRMWNLPCLCHSCAINLYQPWNLQVTVFSLALSKVAELCIGGFHNSESVFTNQQHEHPEEFKTSLHLVKLLFFVS